MMMQPNLTNLFLDQSKDHIWMINLDFQLIYANRNYLSLVKEVTGKEQKLYESAFVEGFGEGYIEKWKAYYSRALQGEYFEVEEHYSHPETNTIHYGQITLEPLTGDDDKIFAVACLSRDITHIVKKRSEASQLIDASLDVFCTINEQGNFVYVSAASAKLWGYLPEELIGKAYTDLILEEDVPKTTEAAAAILSGQDTKAFFNRYKKKNGGIAYNLWSVRYDESAKLMYCVARDGKENFEQEEKIQQSEQRFKALVQEGSDLIGIMDAEGNYIYVSPTSISVLGIAPEEFIGRNALELIHPDDVELTLGSLQKITTENKIILEPFRFQNHKNEWRWVETVLTNMLDNPAVKGIVANSRDITESVNSRNQTEASELFNRTVLESSPDCLKVLDIEGRIQYMNFNGLCHMEIDDFSTVKNKNWGTLWGSDNEVLIKTSIDKALKGETSQFTAFCPTAKGTPKWWDVLVSPAGKPDELVQQIISVSRDITKQKKEEQRLKLLESVITNTKDAILITEAQPQDEPGPKIIYVNEAFTKMTGYKAHEVIGKSPRMLQGPHSNKEELAKLGRALRNWEPYEMTTINYKKNGEEFWINFTVTPVADEKGWYTHWIAIERDVTDQQIKELENKLLAQISLIFNTEINLTSAANELCKTISKFGNFDWVELWTSNLEKSQMQLFSHHVAQPDDEKFYDYNPEFNAFKKSRGLAGMVWSKRAQLIWSDVDTNTDYLRRDAAKKIGLKSMLGIPLLAKDEVVGVLHIGTKHDTNYLKNYARIFQKLEIFLGSELYRKNLENDLSHLFNAIPDIICVLDFQGRFLKINKSGCDLLGYAQEDLLYHKIDEFVPSKEKGVFTNEVKLHKKEETSFKFENRHITKSGEIVWLSWYCNSAWKKGLIYATAQNITEEKKLRELNRQVGRLAKIGSWEVDLVNQSVYWSEEVHRLHETDPKSFVPNLETGINFYRVDFRQMVQLNIEKSIATGEPFDFEAVLVTAKKKELWIRAIGNAEIVDGICKGLFGSFQDISSLKNTENRLLSLSENLPGVVYQYVIHPDGTDSIQYISGMVEQLWGYTTNEVMENIHLLWDLIKLGGDIEEVKASILKSIQTKSRWTCRFKIVMPTGELKTHLGNGTPIFLADGSIVFNVIILDITQEAKNEELLKQVTKLARIGSWEMDLINQDGDGMYWSPMLFEIVEVDDSYNPTLTGGIEFHIGESKERIQNALNLLITDGIEFDEEILLRTAKGHERWSRAIGKSEIVNNTRTKIYGSYQDIHERKKAEEAIRDSEEKRRLIMSGALDAIISMDTNGIITFWNPQAEVIFGWKEAEVMGQPLSELIVPVPLRKYHTEGLKQYLKTGEGRAINALLELKALRKNGEEFPIELTVIPIKQGEEVFFCAFIRDITERKVAEIKLSAALVELKAERKRLVTAQSIAKVGNWETDLQTWQVNWSEEMHRLYGTDPNKFEPSYELIQNFVQPEDRKIIDKAFKASLHKSGSNSVEHRIITLQGIEKWVEENWTVSRDKMGSPMVAFGTCQDITESKKTAEKVIRSEAKLNVAQYIAHVGSYEIDMATNEQSWSDEFYRILGIKTDITPAREAFLSSIHPDDRAMAVSTMEDALSKYEDSSFQFRFIRKNGETGYASSEWKFEFDAHGNPHYLYGILRDLTKEKKAESERLKMISDIVQRNSDLEQFSYIVSHNLRAPTANIIGFAEILQDDTISPQDQKELLQGLSASVSGLDTIIKDINTILQTKREVHDKKEIVIFSKLVNDIKLSIGNLIDKHNVRIISDFSEVDEIYSLKVYLYSIFYNLISNSIKYSKPNEQPLIEIKSKQENGKIILIFKDNGLGMDMTTKGDKIFGLYNRFHSHVEGKGMGLFMVKTQVESLGGKITIASELNEGTEFTIVFEI